MVLGAHYDHLGHDCDSDDPDDAVCNGASDNASGVAAVLEIGRRLAEDPPSRSVVLALWDAEEDDKLGSMAAVESGALDIRLRRRLPQLGHAGHDLLPSLVGHHLGHRGRDRRAGARRRGLAMASLTPPPPWPAVAIGVGSTDLLPVVLSLLFGQGRSDHASFVEAGVPSVFFSDATLGLYHTAQDDLEHLDLDKLARQIDLGETVTHAVAGPGARPTFTANAPAVSFADAEAVLAFVQRAEADLDRYPGTPKPTSSSSSQTWRPWSPAARPPSTTTTPPPSSPAPPLSSSCSPRATATTSSTDRWRTCPLVRHTLRAGAHVAGHRRGPPGRRGSRRADVAGRARLVADRPAVTSVILGARTVAQLDDNLGAAGLHLSDEEAELLNDASAPLVADYPYGAPGIDQRSRDLG